jgi:hypothetical protein
VRQIINLYANDGQRIFDGISMLTNLLAGPLVVIGATAYAIYLLGAWALIGFGILLLVLPLQVNCSYTVEGLNSIQFNLNHSILSSGFVVNAF